MAQHFSDARIFFQELTISVKNVDLILEWMRVDDHLLDYCHKIVEPLDVKFEFMKLLKQFVNRSS